MKKCVTTSFLMAVAGFFVGWHTASGLFMWFVTALDGFFRVPDPHSWTVVYFRFALGAAGLFAAPVWVTRTATPKLVLVYLSIGIAVSVQAAIFWHWRIGGFRRDLGLYDMILPPLPTSLPCLSIPIAGLVAQFCAAFLYRFRGRLHRFFDATFRRDRVVAQYDY